MMTRPNSRQGRFRLVFALFLLALIVAFWHWQAPGTKLAPGEIGTYLGRMATGLPMPAADKAEFLTRLRSWGDADDGKPVHMLNLIRFHDQMPPVPGHPEFTGTAEEANAHYERVIIPLLVARGIYPVFASAPQGLGQGVGAATKATNLLGFEAELEGWDRVMLVRYPSRRAFLDLASDSTYMTVVPYKLAAIDLGFVPLDKQYMLPDLRWITAIVGIGIFLAAVWPGLSRRR
jgi:hypothetical protein